MKKAVPCAIIGCNGLGRDKHHIGGTGSPMIWVCKDCHGIVHGIQWSADHSALTKAGLARARAEGRVGGNPHMGTLEFIALAAKARRDHIVRRFLDSGCLPIVQELRPRTTWRDVARAVSGHSGEAWSGERLRRTVIYLVDAGLADRSLLRRAPGSHVARFGHNLLPLVRALRQDKTLSQVAHELERLGERTPRGGVRWSPSSVFDLLKRAA
jgi:hypothetical protein